MTELHSETLVLGGYALFLLVAAAMLDILARHSHRRSERYRTAGFRYHGHLDAWECPEGQQLWPHERDHQRRLVRYRGAPHVCNACSSKPDCTDSDEGREIVRFLDEWPRMEAGRFHRGLALTLIALAALLVAVALVRHHDPAELAVLGSLLALIGLIGWHLAPALLPHRAPARLPSAHEAASRLDPALARPPPRPGGGAAASPGGGARRT